jgi:hypothetical protein
MDIQCTVNVSSQKISDQLITAFEGGSNYWCQTAELTSSERSPTERPWYASSIVFDGPFTFEVGFDDPDQDEGNGNGFRTIGKADLVAGLHVMATKHPRHFADLMSEDGDAITADVFLQCIVLGDVVYG